MPIPHTVVSFPSARKLRPGQEAAAQKAARGDGYDQVFAKVGDDVYVISQPSLVHDGNTQLPFVGDEVLVEGQAGQVIGRQIDGNLSIKLGLCALAMGLCALAMGLGAVSAYGVGALLWATLGVGGVCLFGIIAIPAAGMLAGLAGYMLPGRLIDKARMKPEALAPYLD